MTQRVKTGMRVPHEPARRERWSAKAGGFTLIELLVSIGIFVLLGVLLVGLLKSGVEIWDRGEVRRDSYERAANLLDRFRDDLSCASIHREPVAPGAFYSNFTCEFDSHERPRLWFTRVGLSAPPATTAAPKGSGDTVYYAPVDTSRRYEIVYCFDPDPSVARLYRGVLQFNNDFGTRLPRKLFDDPAWVGGQCSPLGDGIIYLGFRFWSQNTQAWNDSAAGQVVAGTVWDSTRFVDRNFEMFRKNMKTNDPLDDVLPRRVEITLTLEHPSTLGSAASVLGDDVGDDAKILETRLLASFPQGPGFFKLDDEWISYETKKGSTLTGIKRGVRNTKPAGHSKGTVLRWGETFSTVVAIPAYKDDDNP